MPAPSIEPAVTRLLPAGPVVAGKVDHAACIGDEAGEAGGAVAGENRLAESIGADDGVVRGARIVELQGTERARNATHHECRSVARNVGDAAALDDQRGGTAAAARDVEGVSRRSDVELQAADLRVVAGCRWW